MKCQHCGIHFDDEERVCPMCGARAGSKGRMTRPEPKWHGKPRETYTEYHPTIENSSSAKTAKSKARPIKDKPKKNRAKGAVIAIIVIALLQIVPAIFAFVVDDLVPEIESSFGNSPAPDYGSDYSDDYDTDYDSDYAYDTLYDVFGDNGITVSAFDNVYTFQASGDGSSYEFSYTENGNRTFRRVHYVQRLPVSGASGDQRSAAGLVRFYDAEQGGQYFAECIPKPHHG